MNVRRYDCHGVLSAIEWAVPVLVNLERAQKADDVYLHIGAPDEENSKQNQKNIQGKFRYCFWSNRR